MLFMLLLLLLLQLGYCSRGLRGRGLPPGSPLAARSSVDELLIIGIVRRSIDDFAEDWVKVKGKAMTAWIDVDGWFKGLDVYGLFDTSFHPIMFGRQDGDVFFAEMMVIFPSMLQHCRLVLAKSISRGGRMLLEAGSCSAFSLTYISAWAWCEVGASAGNVVDVACCFFFLKFVFGLY